MPTHTPAERAKNRAASARTTRATAGARSPAAKRANPALKKVKMKKK